MTHSGAVPTQRSEECWLQEKVAVLDLFSAGRTLLTADTHGTSVGHLEAVIP